LKDRLYTYGADSQGRRSAQTVLYWTLKVLIKLIAPVFPFTAEQAFSHFHNWAGKKDSVFLHKMSEDQQLDKFIDKEALKNGERMLGMRTQVLREIERKREKGIIGTSLEAHISLSLDKEYDFFKSRQEQLKEVFVVSGVDVSQGEFNIKVDKSRGEKCPRCWNYREDIGEDGEYPDVCLRCAEALKGGKNG
jgi:isoleucyl-tRNA synthetase